MKILVFLLAITARFLLLPYVHLGGMLVDDIRQYQVVLLFPNRTARNQLAICNILHYPQAMREQILLFTVNIGRMLGIIQQKDTGPRFSEL